MQGEEGKGQCGVDSTEQDGRELSWAAWIKYSEVCTSWVHAQRFYIASFGPYLEYCMYM